MFVFCVCVLCLCCRNLLVKVEFPSKEKLQMPVMHTCVQLDQLLSKIDQNPNHQAPIIWTPVEQCTNAQGKQYKYKNGLRRTPVRFDKLHSIACWSMQKYCPVLFCPARTESHCINGPGWSQWHELYIIWAELHEFWKSWCRCLIYIGQLELLVKLKVNRKAHISVIINSIEVQCFEC